MFKKRNAHYSVRRSEINPKYFKIVMAYDNRTYDDIDLGYFNDFDSAYKVAVQLNELKSKDSG